MKRIKRLLLLSSFLVVGVYTQTLGPISRISSTGVIESLGLELKFNRPVVRTQRGVKEIRLSDFESEFSNVREFFESIAHEYGQFRIIKQVPKAMWGDTIKPRLTDGVLVKVEDVSQIYHLRFSGYIPVDEVVSRIRELPQVEYAHPPVEVARLADPPGDPYYQNQWNLSKTVAEKAWGITGGSSNISVAIIEGDGLPQKNHPDLLNKWDAEKGDQGEGGDDHATRVAGIVGAETDNDIGIASIGRGLKMSRYFFNLQEPDQPSLVEAIADAYGEGNRVINCSFLTVRFLQIPGSPCWVRVPRNYSTVATVIHNAIELGATVVGGYGNSKGWLIYRQPCTNEELSDYFPFDPYPAAYDGAIAVSATGANDLWAEGQDLEDPMEMYNYGFDVRVAAPGMNVLTTGSSGSYGDSERGTSFAAPHVSAIAGLVLSLNPLLSSYDVRDIIAGTADKKGQFEYNANGWNQYMGFGRVNAHKALIQTLALQGQSTHPAATAHNNSHILERDNVGNLHFVFQSSGHIVYARSTDNGSTWKDTKILSGDDASNEFPSIAITSTGGTYLHVVWQRKVSNTIYELWSARSTDAGAKWSNPNKIPGAESIAIAYGQSNENGGPGPTPVIAGMNGSSSKLLCVWSQYDGLKYQSSNSLTSWPGTINSVPNAASSNVWHPSLATAGTAATRAYLVYGKRASTGVYSIYFDANAGAWSNTATIGSGGYDRYPSIAVGPGLYSAWSRYNNGRYDIRFRFGNLDNTWSSWVDHAVISPSLNSFYPSVSYFLNEPPFKEVALTWSAYGGSTFLVKLKKYHEIFGWNPTMYELSSNGIHATLTHEWTLEDPVMIWTDLSSSPYQITSSQLPQMKMLRSDEHLLKTENNKEAFDAFRGIEIYDSKNQVTLNIRLRGLPFKKYDYEQKLQLGLDNVFEYLQADGIDPRVVPNLNIECETQITRPDTLEEGNTWSGEIMTNFAGLELTLEAWDGDTRIQEY